MLINGVSTDKKDGFCGGDLMMILHYLWFQEQMHLWVKTFVVWGRLKGFNLNIGFL